MVEMLASTPDEIAVPMTAIGYGIGNESGETAEWFR
jgi:hypothetical protein